MALAAALLTLAAGSAAPSRALAEEGMWTFDNFPVVRANATLGTNIDQAWLDRVRLSSVKFGGCSAGIVSAEGLVMTNNHCVATCVANLSTQAVNYAETGFAPRGREDELKCPGGTAEILTDISDVTARMHAAGDGLEGQAFTRARDAEAGRIEQEACGGDAGKRCQVVSLYRGGQFKLYTYKRYADVRLAWAPEDRAATFGATWTISASRASPSMRPSSGSTRTAPRRRRRSISSGTRRSRSRARRFSWPVRLARPSGC